MPSLSEVCHDIRSKNAGPFWITVDLFFHGREAFDRYAQTSLLQPQALAKVFDVQAEQVGCYPVPELCVLKISYPRKDPQGGMIERDLHGGQQFARLVDIELG
ncbi:DUF4387 domain-containing protein [Piscinibacter sakaiensis]|uniref:DUF4387 domain-containing protein n=1 Tax=Piscinibacter sakaiensis TaxID=1547922 RepID=UPI003AAFC5A7